MQGYMKVWLEKGVLICIEGEIFHQPERKENNQNYYKLSSKVALSDKDLSNSYRIQV